MADREGEESQTEEDERLHPSPDSLKPSLAQILGKNRTVGKDK